MSNFKVSQLPASAELVVEDIIPIVDVSEGLTKKAEVGDFVDLVKSQINGGDGITYTAATGEVKLTNKSITINSTVVNLGDTISIPTGGTTYTAGSGINIDGTTISNAGVTDIVNSNTNATDISNTGGSFNVGVKSSPSFNNVVIINPSTTFPALEVTQPAGGTAAVKIINNGTGNCLEVQDVTGDTTPFVINNIGEVSTGKTLTVGGSLIVAGNITTDNTVFAGGITHSGSYSNSSYLRLTASITINATHNFLYVSGTTNVTATLPALANPAQLGTEYTFRKFDGSLCVRPANNERIEFIQNNNILFTSTGGGLFKLKAISQDGTDTWIVIDINGTTPSFTPVPFTVFSP